jgi:hypothetical protein
MIDDLFVLRIVVYLIDVLPFLFAQFLNSVSLFSYLLSETPFELTLLFLVLILFIVFCILSVIYSMLSCLSCLCSDSIVFYILFSGLSAFFLSPVSQFFVFVALFG